MPDAKDIPGADEVVEAVQDPDDNPLGLSIWVGLILAAAAILWLAGFLFLRAAGQPTRSWSLTWGLAGISFLFAFVPLPGFTSALLFALARSGWVFGLLGVAGAAVGGTVAAGLLLALGHTGRKHLRKRATKSARARKVLAWSKKAAKKWTYAGIFVLLVRSSPSCWPAPSCAASSCSWPSRPAGACSASQRSASRA